MAEIIPNLSPLKATSSTPPPPATWPRLCLSCSAVETTEKEADNDGKLGCHGSLCVWPLEYRSSQPTVTHQWHQACNFAVFAVPEKKSSSQLHVLNFQMMQKSWRASLILSVKLQGEHARSLCSPGALFLSFNQLKAPSFHQRRLIHALKTTPCPLSPPATVSKLQLTIQNPYLHLIQHPPQAERAGQQAMNYFNGDYE